MHGTLDRTSGRGRLVHRCALALAAAALLLAAGCEVAEPELPTFTTRLAVPLGEERLDVADALEDTDYLVELPDGALGFLVEGDPDTVALDFDLTVDLAPLVVEETLGAFPLDVAEPVRVAFALADLYPPAAELDGQSLAVPPFPLAQDSPPRDVGGVESAVLASGTLAITVRNDLPLPVGDAPGALVLELCDGESGATLVVVPFDPIGPGATATRSADLAGVTLPGTASVRLAGTCPGSGGAPVSIDAGATVEIDAAFTGLTVTAAVAQIGPQEFHHTTTSPLPDDHAVLEAVIATGATALAVTNRMSIPCRAEVTWPHVVDLDDHPLSVVLDLAPGAAASRDVEFAGRIVRAPGGEPLRELVCEVAVSSPGSGDDVVALAAQDGLRAELGAATLTFAAVTGTVPPTVYDLAPRDVAIDLPDELSGVAFTAAALTLELENAAGVGADLDLTLTGTSAAGEVATLAVDAALLPAEADRAVVTVITLDETDSDIVGFLANLPTRIAVAGRIATRRDEIGTVRGDDRAVLRWRIAAPVEVVVQDAVLYGDPEPLDLDDDARDLLRDHAGDALVDLEVLNHLPVGIEVRLLFAVDPEACATAPLLAIGPLAVAAAARDPETHVVAAPVVSRPQVVLDAAETRLLGTPGLHARLEARLPDTDGEPARVLTTDYVTIRGLVRLDVEVTDD